jgi:hypothetical protein
MFVDGEDEDAAVDLAANRHSSEGGRVIGREAVASMPPARQTPQSDARR